MITYHSPVACCPPVWIEALTAYLGQNISTLQTPSTQWVSVLKYRKNGIRIILTYSTFALTANVQDMHERRARQSMHVTMEQSEHAYVELHPLQLVIITQISTQGLYN